MEQMKTAPIKPTISFADFEKIDVRVGLIEQVEALPSSSKLVKLIVDFGDHQRRIIAGLKREGSDVREVEGKQALFVVNLEPREMAGEVSEGKLFDIGYSDGLIPVLAIPEKEVPNGARAG